MNLSDLHRTLETNRFLITARDSLVSQLKNQTLEGPLIRQALQFLLEGNLNACESYLFRHAAELAIKESESIKLNLAVYQVQPTDDIPF